MTEFYWTLLMCLKHKDVSIWYINVLKDFYKNSACIEQYVSQEIKFKKAWSQMLYLINIVYDTQYLIYQGSAGKKRKTMGLECDKSVEN